MAKLSALIEACLLAASKPLSLKDLSTATGVSEADTSAVIDRLWTEHNRPESGIHILKIDGKFQLASNPEHADVVRKLAKQEEAPELTRPSLEALTIIAYRGPVTKPEIEAIRGVNCSLILRNLLMRGLIEAREDHKRLQPVYLLSADTLRYMGLHSVNELPDYDSLHANAQIDTLLHSLLEDANSASRL